MHLFDLNLESHDAESSFMEYAHPVGERELAVAAVAVATGDPFIEISAEELEALEFSAMVDEDDADFEDNEVWYLSEPESESDSEENDIHDNQQTETETNLHDNQQNETGLHVNPILTKKRHEQDNKGRTHLAQRLLVLSRDWVRLPTGVSQQLQDEFDISRSTVSRMWKNVREQGKLGPDLIDVKNKKTGKVGRKPRDFDTEIMLQISQKARTTIQSFASALECSPSMVYKLLKKGIIRSHTNSIKPTVSAAHKITRLKWILGLTLPRTVTQQSTFMSLSNFVHIDENWFFMSKNTQRYYLLAGEEEPYRHIQSKNYTEKVMFLSGVARPIIASGGEVIWDGKIGIWAFTDEVAAIRTSKNRERGTIETKATPSITKNVIRRKMLDELLPTIRAKWPANACKTIWIQQDNARPHIFPNDPEFLEEANKYGFDIHLICQPAQSPDLNVLDLGFFRGIQSLQHQKFPKNVTELVQSVHDAYMEYDPKSLNHTWLQLQYVMVEILKQKGGNNYKSPHQGKKRLERLGLLPTDTQIQQHIIDDAVDFLNEGFVVAPGAYDYDIDMEDAN
ncbi:uncharacterized protein [Spinacia oleracea]|uniref:Transposase n=1 Tax=Spinacia oleracea TaxID=3562 RepID=A0A9R0HZB8_SPIOL|nr:uncharacterized protein LOC110779611 [Spinacia oleracea]